MNLFVKPSFVSGIVKVPGDKSISQRALIIGALASGQTVIKNLLTSADCLSTLNCLRQLGVNIALEKQQAVVQGVGLFGLKEPDDLLNVGNSGTALRMLPGLLAGQNLFAVITGDSSIRQRPVDRIVKPLRLMGAAISARQEGKFAPLAIEGRKLQAINYSLPVASAQVKSCLLLAALLAEGETVIEEPLRCRDHTERLFQYLEIPLKIKEEDGRWLSLKGQVAFQAKPITVPGDFSTAAFLVTAGILAAKEGLTVEKVGLNPTRTGFLTVLQQMGAKVILSNKATVNNEPIADLTVQQQELTATEVDGSLIPLLIDEIPLIALLATQAKGTTVIKDAQELRVKETDRISTVTTELTKMGAKIKATADGFIIKGPTKLKGAVVHSHFDHRLAMMLAVAGLVATDETVVEGMEAANVSFPQFPEVFKKIRGVVKNK